MKPQKNSLKEKSNFDKLAQEIYEFEKQAGFDDTTQERLVIALKNEIHEHETAEKQEKRDKKLINFIVIAMQIARRRNVSLDELWKTWWKKSEKYLGENKEKYKEEYNKELRH